MATQEEYRATRREKTREMAAALVDDLAFIRVVTAAAAITAGDVRRLSALLRRILVEAVLERVAGPRVGKIRLLAPVTDKALAANAAKPFHFLGVGPVSIFGINLGFVALDHATTGRSGLDGFDGFVSLDSKHFLDQGVIAYNGIWISRRDIIKYIANVADGVHSGEARDEHARFVGRARHAAVIKKVDGDVIVDTDPFAFSAATLPPIIDGSKIDWVLAEIITAAQLLSASPEVMSLEQYISLHG